MKTWFTKLRIASAINHRRALPPSLQAAIARSEELRRYAEQLASLNQTLRDTAENSAPPALHDDIMRAVRTSNQTAISSPSLTWMEGFGWARLAGASVAIALLLGLGVWLALRPNTLVNDLSQPVVTAQQHSDPVTRMVSASGVAPLTDEWNRLNRDLNGAADLLLASVP